MINTISTFLVVKVLNIFTFVNTYNCGDEVLFHMCNLFAAFSQRTQGEVFGRINYMKHTEHTNIHTFKLEKCLENFTKKYILISYGNIQTLYIFSTFLDY